MSTIALLLLSFRADGVVVLALSLSLILLIYYDHHQASESGRALERISITREVAKVVTELEDVEVRVFVENSSGRDIALAEVIDSVPEFLSLKGKPSASMVLPKETVAVFSYSVRPLLPGCYSFREVEARAFGPLGLFMTQKRVLSPTSITVLPHYGGVGIPLRSMGRLWGLVIRGKAVGGMYDLADFREYSPGDDHRKIVWKAYARTGKLYVREDFGEVTSRVLVLLDVRPWDWSMGEPPNTLASVELRTLRSIVQHLAKYGVPADAGVCCSATTKVVRDATFDVTKALIDIFSYVTPGCHCTSGMSIYSEAPRYMGRSTSDYAAVLLITNPVSLAVENPARLVDLIKAYGGNLRILIPRFDYERYIDQGDAGRLYRVISGLLERSGGSLEVLEENMALHPIRGRERWK